MKSFAQDLVFGVTRGRIKPPKQILLSYAVKTLTNNVELVSILNRYGHGISYSQLEEINTALCMQKMATTTSEIPLPANIQPHVSTTLAWDNIDRLEETLSGEGTSHRVNSIAVQARHFGPHPLTEQPPGITKSKQRSVEPLDVVALPIYNAGERQGPKPRAYVEVNNQEALENARRKNLLWVLVRLHAQINQKVSGWSGYNILVCNEIEARQDNIGYLPTIDAPATSMSTVVRDEADVKSLIALLESNWINPFSAEQQDLVCLSTGKVVTQKIEEDLLGANAVGEKAYKEFRAKRLEANPPVKFHETMKSKLKTFSDLNKKVKFKSKTENEIILKADRALFGQIRLQHIECGIRRYRCLHSLCVIQALNSIVNIF